MEGKYVTDLLPLFTFLFSPCNKFNLENLITSVSEYQKKNAPLRLQIQFKVLTGSKSIVFKSEMFTFLYNQF